jgi:hypothetical protein
VTINNDFKTFLHVLGETKTKQKNLTFVCLSVCFHLFSDIPNMYKFHSQKSKDVEVDLIRIVMTDESSSIGSIDSDASSSQNKTDNIKESL